MKISIDSNAQITVGSFSSRIEENILFLPSILMDFAKSQSLNSAEEFAGYVHTFPSTLAYNLGWNPNEVITASTALNKQLSTVGIIITSPPSRVYGFG